MKCFKILFLMVVFSTMNVVAQKDNATKIVGCWILKKMELTDPKFMSAKMQEEALNSEVCFTADGKYSTAKRGKEQTQITGTYQFEDDGKTLTQKSDRNNGGMDEDATIALLNEQELVFEIEIGKMYFVRKKD
jgi:hypothetical protein